MTDRESLDLPLGRWLLWGLAAILGLLAIVIFFASLTQDTSSSPTAAGEQVEWSIQTSEYTPTPGQVTLMGDVPLGFPTETWKDGVMLARTVDVSMFDWKMDVDPEVPIPVYDIDQAGSCAELNDELNDWASAVASAQGDARSAEASAFAQHALDTMVADGCEPSLDS